MTLFKVVWCSGMLMGMIWPPQTSTPLIDAAILSVILGFLAEFCVLTFRRSLEIHRETERMKRSMGD